MLQLELLNLFIRRVMESNNDSKVTQERVLICKNFKNIGVSKLNESYELKDKPEDFLLNTNYKGDKPGGLVIVIGENNTGKSNIKQALQKFMYEFESYNDKCRVFNSNDLPNYIDYDSCEPSLEFVIKDYKTGGGGKYLYHTC